MPLLKIEALDEEPIEDATTDCTGGQFSNARRNLLAPSQWAKLQNVMLQSNGPAGTRRGCDRIGTDAAGADVVQGIGYLDTDALEQLVRVRAGVVEYHEGATGEPWQAAPGFTPDATARVQMVQGLDKLYLFNGEDAVHSWDGASFVSLASVPVGRTAAWFTNRMMVAGVDGAPDTLYFSDILDAGAGYDASQQIRVGAGDGDPIVCLVPWTKTLLAVFKRASIWVVNCEPSTAVGSMTVDEVPLQIGCAARRGACRVGADVWFLANDMTVRSLMRVMDGADNDVAQPISYPIADELEVINRTVADLACCVMYGSRFLIALPTYTATQPNVVLSYNLQLKTWEGAWTNWRPTCWQPTYFGGQKRLSWGQSDGRVLRWRDSTPPISETDEDFSDAGTDIPTLMRTRNHTWGAAQNGKRPLHAEIEFNQSMADEVALTLIRDDVLDALAAATLISGEAGVELGLPGVNRASLNLMHESPAREWGLQIEAPAGKLVVRTVQWSAFIETLDVVAVPEFSRLDAGAWTPGDPVNEDPTPPSMPAVLIDGNAEMAATLTVEVLTAAMPAALIEGAGTMEYWAAGGNVVLETFTYGAPSDDLTDADSGAFGTEILTWGDATDEAATDANSGSWNFETGD
jgi:hypothetical protein